MKVEEFEAAITKGLGRAYQYVVKHGDSHELVRHWLEKACVENLAYDPQCEGDRCKWLYRILEQTSNLKHYQDFLIKELSSINNTSDSTWDINHQYGLLKLFSEHGSSDARDLLYKHFSKNLRTLYNESWVGGSQIIDLDGLEGFLFVVKVIGEKLSTVEDFSEDDYLLRCIVETVDENLVMDALTDGSKTCEYTKIYMNEVIPLYKEEKLRIREARNTDVRSFSKKRERFEFTQEQVLEKLEDSKDSQHLSFYMAYGRVATEIEIEQIISRMISESREVQLIRYAWIFRRRYVSKEKMPETLIVKMLELLSSKNKELTQAVRISLSYVDDDRVRTAGIALIQNSSQSDFFNGIELLANSIKQEDTETIAKYFFLVESKMKDCEQLHSIVLDLINIADNLEMDSHLQAVLEHCYVLTPCSHCRDCIYDHLSSMEEEVINSKIKAEHAFDSFDRT